MSVPAEYKTEKGTVLPLINLKGKPYLAVAHRLVWLTERYSRYEINTDILSLQQDSAVARTVVKIYADDGQLIRAASATKRETMKDFPDFIEKAETGSLGRALAMLGLGTQFCIPDLDEGDRLADAPIPLAKRAQVEAAKPSTAETPVRPKTTFNKNKPATTEVAETKTPSKVEVVDGWE